MKFLALCFLSLLVTSTAFSRVPPVAGAPFEHAPYGARACSVCHERDDEANPGKITAPIKSLCLGCHTDFGAQLEALPHVHEPSQMDCTNCHNPHNGGNDKFLSDVAPKLCLNCHSVMATELGQSKLKHGAIESGAACLNCHNPHASKVEKLLKALPYDLCINCHNNSNIADHDGKKLVNIKELIETRPNKHGPVAAKDCSSCHNPHAGNNFRLLVESYPAKFYSPFDPENYALCFTCHDPGIVTTPQTTAITGFRNGSRNLHFVHVNQDWGRTCRACHEVHAAEKIHIIRDSVPYGNSGWNLKINYEATAAGGKCSKTCHTTKEYARQ